MKSLCCVALLLATIFLPTASRVVAADAAPSQSKPAVLEAARFVELSGRIHNPGRILFPEKGGLTLLQAVGGAGHHNYNDLRAIKITRTQPDGQSVTFLVDIHPMLQGEQRDLPLAHGDRIFIPDRQRVTVTGEVRKPGPVSFPQEGGLSLIAALGAADGHTRFADLRAVEITRTDSSGQTTTFLVDANAILMGRQRDLPLRSGDRVVIPDRRV